MATDKDKWYEFVGKDLDYTFEDENEDRVWYCSHGRAYGIRCRKCEEDDE